MTSLRLILIGMAIVCLLTGCPSDDDDGTPPTTNTPPVAANDAATTAEDTAVTIAVLANDTDADGDVLSITNITTPANGTATLAGTAVVYTPAGNFNGSNTFTYTISDGQGGTASATVTVTVTPVNDPPTAVDDVAQTDQSSQPVALSIAVLGNDTDIDSTINPATVTLRSAPANGTAVVDTATGQVRYTPGVNFAGTDTFTYSVNDAQNARSNNATVTVTVNQVPMDFMTTVERLLAIPLATANQLDPEPLNAVLFMDQFDNVGEPVPLP